MITDTAQVEIVKQNELGGYDTMKTSVVYSCFINGRYYVRYADGKAGFLQEKAELIEHFIEVKK